MAKLVNPLLSLEARGKANGVIYNSWRGISYAKSFASPAQPRTSSQLLARSRLTTYSQGWKSLTDAQRTDWQSFASTHLLTDWTGTPKRITSQNWYIRCNVQIARCSGTPISTPPADPAPSGITGLSLTYASSALKLSWTTPTSASLNIEAQLQGPYSSGRQPRFNEATTITISAGNAAQPVTLVSSPASGRYTVWARVIDPATGLTSLWTLSTVDV